ncbi:hypothetical protein TNCV_1594351 [Trichonephila clavipes]|nr:hypothetical protein TNCV_1594351 [Trichonephila clavipes]
MNWKNRRVPTDHREGRHNKEVQLVPEKSEKGTIVHTSRREQDQKQECQTRRVTDPEVYKKLTYTKNGAKEKM